MVGLVIPLPLFDRNQGNIAEAHQRVDKAIDEQAAIELRLKTELTQAYEALVGGANGKRHIARRNYSRGQERVRSHQQGL